MSELDRDKGWSSASTASDLVSPLELGVVDGADMSAPVSGKPSSDGAVPPAPPVGVNTASYTSEGGTPDTTIRRARQDATRRAHDKGAVARPGGNGR